MQRRTNSMAGRVALVVSAAMTSCWAGVASAAPDAPPPDDVPVETPAPQPEVAVGLPPVPPTTVVVAVGLPPVPPVTIPVAPEPAAPATTVAVTVAPRPLAPAAVPAVELDPEVVARQVTSLVVDAATRAALALRR